MVPLSPRRGAAPPPPPPLPPWVGRAGTGARQCDKGGAGQHVGQTVSGAPRSTGARRPVGGGGGGALEPGLHSASPVIGRGGRPTPHSRPAAGAGGRDGGARAWWTFLAPSRPCSLQRRGQMGHRVTSLFPGIASCRGLQGPGASPPLHEQGQHGAAGQDLGQPSAAGRAVLQTQGQPEAAALGQGCQGQGQGRQGGPPLPPAQRSPPPPPPLPPWAGRAGTGARQCDKGGQGSTWGRPSAAPLTAQGRGSPSVGPGGGGGLLSLGFTRRVQSSGGGGRPTAHSRTCGRGWGSAQPEIWAGSLLGGSHIGWRPRFFRRAAIRWGGRGG